jgi:hypothetical protein
LEPGVTELAAGRVRPTGGPEPNATGTAELIVQQSDCASDLKVNNAPDESFPAVFATTRRWIARIFYRLVPGFFLTNFDSNISSVSGRARLCRAVVFEKCVNSFQDRLDGVSPYQSSAKKRRGHFWPRVKLRKVYVW